MKTVPSKRELRHFLKRYVPQMDSSSSMLVPPQMRPSSSGTGLHTSEKYVESLLSPTANQIAVTKVEGPFEKSGWKAVGSTLIKLQKLGLTSIVVMDNINWLSANESPTELSKAMIYESMALSEAIENAGGRARPFHSGVLERGAAVEGIDVQLDFLQSALLNGQIPILVPNLTHDNGRQQPISANDVMLAVTQKLAKRDEKPAKVVVINNEGGIANHERPGTAHSLINIQEEYDQIVDVFQQRPDWREMYPTAISNLTMIRNCLSELPTTSSAIMVPIASLPSALITNLVTDKPLYSSSLPTEDLRCINKMRATVLRHGIKIHNYDTLDALNLDKLTALMEASFQKKLDVDGFYTRLRHVLAGAIIAGDYEGAVIMTKETPPGMAEGHYYLDKFAIAPTSQGIGLTDILWKRMCDAYPELLWRSRKDNGVNKWYFERSNGYLRLKDTNWVLFWHGPGGFRHIGSYAEVARSIPASFSGPLK
ncbi:hypothetical protein BX666DRAFT_2040992 [Dichotomocladium elegans]|nr:hypothetical protein BX666DRAFT_2040992 [Dichotomocladium elegans]